MSVDRSSLLQFVEELVNRASEAVFEDGVPLMTVGSVADAVFYVISGEVAVMRGEQEIARLGAGSVLGEMGVITDTPRNATVKAVGQVSALRIESEIFVRALDKEPGLLRAMYRDLHEKIGAGVKPGDGSPEPGATGLQDHLNPVELERIAARRRIAKRETCWYRIGVWGDRSCPELAKHTHCQNCPVFSAGGRSLLERPMTDEYLGYWTDLMAGEKEEKREEAVTLLLFRLGEEWFALPAALFREMTTPRRIQRIPHRSSESMLGITSIHGQLHLTFSLFRLLGLTENKEEASKSRKLARFGLIDHGGESWVFPMDEVAGVQPVETRLFEPPPVTLVRSAGAFTKSVFPFRDTHVALLDEGLMFYQLKKDCN